MALAVVNLQDRMDHYPSQLSGGRSSALPCPRRGDGPDILVADEPTGDLDRVSAEDVLASWGG